MKCISVTLNPSFDYIWNFKESLVKNQTNRCNDVDLYAAGKGIHVAMMLKSLHTQHLSISLSGPLCKSYFQSKLNETGIKYHLIMIDDEIRINLKLIDGEQTECNAPGPLVKRNEFERLLEYVSNVIEQGDVVTLNGSLPRGLDDSCYQQLSAIVNVKKGILAIDASGPSLLKALPEHPFLIKPNLLELSTTLKCSLSDEFSIVRAARKLIALGATNVVVSLGKTGAYLINATYVFFVDLSQHDFAVKNVAGAGDSLLAGFLYQYFKGNCGRESRLSAALKFGVICGTASACSSRIASEAMIKKIGAELIDTVAIDLSADYQTQTE